MKKLITKQIIFDSMAKEEERVIAEHSSNITKKLLRLHLTKQILTAVDENLSPLDKVLKKLGNISTCRDDKKRGFSTYNVGDITESVLRHVLGNTETSSKTTRGNDFGDYEIKYAVDSWTMSSPVNFDNDWTTLILVCHQGVFNLSREEVKQKIKKYDKLSGSEKYDNYNVELSKRLGF